MANCELYINNVPCTGDAVGSIEILAGVNQPTPLKLVICQACIDRCDPPKRFVTMSIVEDELCS